MQFYKQSLRANNVFWVLLYLFRTISFLNFVLVKLLYNFITMVQDRYHFAFNISNFAKNYENENSFYVEILTISAQNVMLRKFVFLFNMWYCVETFI